jgi:hypothetical protein
LLSFAESAPRAYRLKASNAAPPISTSGGTSAAAQSAWVTGYVSAFNNYAEHQSGDISAGTDTDGLFSWIDTYCRSNPLDNLFHASGALIRELEKRALAR